MSYITFITYYRGKSRTPANSFTILGRRVDIKGKVQYYSHQRILLSRVGGGTGPTKPGNHHPCKTAMNGANLQGDRFVLADKR
jgi:hypothetical protein